MKQSAFLLTSNASDASTTLPVLATAGRMVLRGSLDTPTATGADGTRWFAFGSVDGRRGPAGELERVSLDAIADEGLGALEDVEGRMAVIALGPDGGADIVLDPFARRDVFYTTGVQTTHAASEVSLLPGRTHAVDQVALAHALTVYGTRAPKRHTLWSDVRRLGPGETARIAADGAITTSTRRFVGVPTIAHEAMRLDDYADALLEAVRARASEDGNVVYLSSGWDSTCLLACLVHLFGPSKVRAIIGRMVYADRSGVINQFEIDRAKAMADFFDIPLQMVDLDYTSKADRLLSDLLPSMASQQFASLTGLNHAILARFAAETARGDEVIFAGEISDGAHNLGFSQYATYFHPRIEFREMFDKMAGYLFSPSFLRLIERDLFRDDPIYAMFRLRCGGAVFDEPAADIAVRRRQILASLFLRGNRIPFWSIRNVAMLTDVGRDAYQREIEEGYLREAAEHLTPDTAYSWYLHLYNSFHWQGSTVATLPATAEAFGLKCALPFHDGRLQRFLSVMPETAGRALDLHPTKYPLKWMLQNRIRYPWHLQVGPHSYLYDVDPTFSHSAEILYGSSLGQEMRRAVSHSQHRDVLSPEIFNLPYVDAAINRFVAGEEVRGAEMNDLMSLGLLSLIGFGQVTQPV